ncbi:DUF2905 domain-containing protein [Burkholderia multivorans]|uniref:DUF2905 domain-containing protein n=1 Tax=Burkholderia multivorans TaxID=87883 RepID=UPI0009C0274C
MNRFLIAVGVLCILAGLGWHRLMRIPLGRLPGDIHIVRGGFTFDFPIATFIVISVAVSALLWFLRAQCRLCRRGPARMPPRPPVCRETRTSGSRETLPGWILARLRQPNGVSSDFKSVGERKISVRQPR